MRIKDSRLVIAAVVAAFLSNTPAYALTGADVLDKMSKDESGGYLFGSMEMAAFLAHLQGNTERSRCIKNWYTENGGVTQVIQALDRFKDREAMTVMHVLIQKACGK